MFVLTQLIVPILRVPAMVIALKELASVKRDGRVPIAVKWIKMRYNVFLIVPDTALLI